MSSFFHTLLALCLFLHPFRALAAADQSIYVKLDTDNELIPLYLADFYHHQAEFSSEYLKQLQEILKFDLDHNGTTYVLQKNPEAEKGAGSSYIELQNIQSLKTSGCHYLAKAQIQNKNLSLTVIALANLAAKSVENIPLTGNLALDRTKIHQVADTVHKALFGSDGIASTRFIYTLKKQAEGSKWISEIWEADYDGANAKPIIQNGEYCVTPTYFPPKPGFTSGGIYYVSYKTGQSKIYIASLKDGKTQRFSLLKGNQMMPAISKQRDQVAFISDYTGNPDLFLQKIRPDGSIQDKPQQIFSAKHATQGSPAFHPNGKKIAFVSNKDGSPRIYIMDIPAPGASKQDLKTTLITKHNRESTAPAWSSDGSKLAYCSMTEGVRQIWIYDFNQHQEKQLTYGGNHKENPTWAPNNKHLIYNTTGNGSELYLISLLQPTPTKISKGPGEKRFPSWEPK